MSPGVRASTLPKARANGKGKGDTAKKVRSPRNGSSGSLEYTSARDVSTIPSWHEP
jgi:hypothetical protein